MSRALSMTSLTKLTWSCCMQHAGNSGWFHVWVLNNSCTEHVKIAEKLTRLRYILMMIVLFTRKFPHPCEDSPLSTV